MASSSDRFKQTEDEYYRLRGQLAAGHISHEQFENSLKSMMIQDAEGRYWSMGADSAKWYVNQGNAWVEADPYAQSASPPPATTLPESTVPFSPPPAATPAVTPSPAAPQPVAVPTRVAAVPPPPAVPTPVAAAPATQRKGGGCGGCLLWGCLAIVLLVVIIGVGGFVAYQSGALTLNNVLKLVGLGAARIEVDNFRDDAIVVNIEGVSSSQNSSAFNGQMSLNSFDVEALQVQNAGKYSVSFQTSDGTKFGSCTLTVRGGDNYQFVTLPDRTVVNRANSPSQNGTDFVIDTSSLCQ